VPRIFYTFSSTEYWARAGSLTHTNEDGTRDVALSDASRLYLLSGSPHASGPLPPIRETTSGEFLHPLNFAQQRWSLRALLIAMDEWVASGTAPPTSRYPTLARGELVPRESVRFPAVPSMALPAYMPGVWRLDFGPQFSSAGIIAEPPRVGRAFTVLVPQVDADGNDRGGVPQLEVAVPLGTHTGWNVTVPALEDLRYLSGLTGSFEPFATTREGRERAGDPRRAVNERYRNRAEYLARISDAARALVRDRFMLAEDVAAATARADAMWTALVESPRTR
jgi:hypothetical protein